MGGGTEVGREATCLSKPPGGFLIVMDRTAIQGLVYPGSSPVHSGVPDSPASALGKWVND